jgi:hypothetical protein
MPVALTVQVRGHDPNGTPWEEMTTTEDFSSGGARFALKKTVRVGQVLLISSPIPKRYRRFALADASYRPYVLVRRVFPAWPANKVAVMFLGKEPPKGYEQNPGELYRLPTDPRPAPKERRQFTRLDVFINLRLRRTDGIGGGPQEERTVTENLSRGGFRAPTAMGVGKGEILVVEDPAGTFSTRAEVRNVYIGKDGVPRINLRFLDGEAPDKLIAAAGIAGLE